jgi:uncharacterized damage-inducible protein DinB
MNRHLAQLKVEVSSYTNEADLWKKTGVIPNSAGNLCLHICGNLQHFIGANLGNTGYIRKREEEFSLQNIPRSELLEQIDSTAKVVSDTLAKLNESELNKNYPQEVFGGPMTTEYFLIHLTAHLAYHLGQINYHRRMLTPVD